MTSKLNTSAISVEIEGARVAKNVPVVSCVCGRGRWDVSSSARVSGSGSLSLAVISILYHIIHIIICYPTPPSQRVREGGGN